MPNGGTDCCGYCWFNRTNRGRAGRVHDPLPGPAACEIRGIEIASPFYTYCANHPKRSPERETSPIGPVWTDRGRGREILHPSPDDAVIRECLLGLLANIRPTPCAEYPLGAAREHTIVWQLGEFGEPRAIDDLERIARFPPQAVAPGPFQAPRRALVDAAREALAKIRSQAAQVRPRALPRPAAVTLEDRVFGVLFGQAVGDALGLGSEFMARKDVEWHYPQGLSRYEQIVQDAHRNRWKPGDWTDDTEQLTMILDSLLETGDVDVRDIGRRISNWVFHAHGTGVGLTVYAVLKHPAFAVDPHAAARAVWEHVRPADCGERGRDAHERARTVGFRRPVAHPCQRRGGLQDHALRPALRRHLRCGVAPRQCARARTRRR